MSNARISSGVPGSKAIQVGGASPGNSRDLCPDKTKSGTGAASVVPAGQTGHTGPGSFSGNRSLSGSPVVLYNNANNAGRQNSTHDMAHVRDLSSTGGLSVHSREEKVVLCAHPPGKPKTGKSCKQEKETKSFFVWLAGKCEKWAKEKEESVSARGNAGGGHIMAQHLEAATLHNKNGGCLKNAARLYRIAAWLYRHGEDPEREAVMCRKEVAAYEQAADEYRTVDDIRKQYKNMQLDKTGSKLVRKIKAEAETAHAQLQKIKGYLPAKEERPHPVPGTGNDRAEYPENVKDSCLPDQNGNAVMQENKTVKDADRKADSIQENAESRNTGDEYGVYEDIHKSIISLINEGKTFEFAENYQQAADKYSQVTHSREFLQALEVNEKTQTAKVRKLVGGINKIITEADDKLKEVKKHFPAEEIDPCQVPGNDYYSYNHLFDGKRLEFHDEVDQNPESAKQHDQDVRVHPEPLPGKNSTDRDIGAFAEKVEKRVSKRDKNADHAGRAGELVKKYIHTDFQFENMDTTTDIIVNYMYAERILDRTESLYKEIKKTGASGGRESPSLKKETGFLKSCTDGMNKKIQEIDVDLVKGLENVNTMDQNGDTMDQNGDDVQEDMHAMRKCMSAMKEKAMKEKAIQKKAMKGYEQVFQGCETVLDNIKQIKDDPDQCGKQIVNLYETIQDACNGMRKAVILSDRDDVAMTSAINALSSRARENAEDIRRERRDAEAGMEKKKSNPGIVEKSDITG